VGDQALLRLHLAALPAWSVLQSVELVGHCAYQSEAGAILGLVRFVGTFSGTVLVLGAVWASSSSLRYWRL
jgi:hypothetical protein